MFCGLIAIDIAKVLRSGVYFDPGSTTRMVDSHLAWSSFSFPSRRSDAHLNGSTSARTEVSIHRFLIRLRGVKTVVLQQIGFLCDQMAILNDIDIAIREYIPDARVAQMLDHYTQYVGSSPDASPAILCAIGHM